MVSLGLDIWSGLTFDWFANIDIWCQIPNLNIRYYTLLCSTFCIIVINFNLSLRPRFPNHNVPYQWLLIMICSIITSTMTIDYSFLTSTGFGIVNSYQNSITDSIALTLISDIIAYWSWHLWLCWFVSVIDLRCHGLPISIFSIHVIVGNWLVSWQELEPLHIHHYQ